jgi:hypothetical protein
VGAGGQRAERSEVGRTIARSHAEGTKRKDNFKNIGIGNSCLPLND